MENQNQNVSADNIYKLNGRVPLSKAIPFGLQHVLAMFVSNLAPVLIVCSAAFVHGTNDHLTGAEIQDKTVSRDHAVITMRDVCCRNWYMSSVISDLEDRIKASDRYGSQLYFPWKSINDLYKSRSWI